MLVYSLIFTDIVSFSRQGNGVTAQLCEDTCPVTNEFVGYNIKVYTSGYGECQCLYEDGGLPSGMDITIWFGWDGNSGTGPVTSVGGNFGFTCYKYHPAQ